MKPELKVAIIGSGMIGTSLSVLFTGNDFQVSVLGVNDTEIKKSRDRYEAYFVDLLDEGLVTEKQIQLCRQNLSYVLTYQSIADADIVFESIFEDLEQKQQVYRNLEKHCHKLKAIGSTTSAFTIEDLLDGLTVHRDKLMVAHPWNPPHLVPLIEVVASKDTLPSAMQEMTTLMEYCGHQLNHMKKGAPGFISNRLQHAMLREAFYMVQEGIAEPKEIDKALKFGFAARYTSVGLFEHQDAAGLDLVKNIEDYLFPLLCSEQKASQLVNACCEKGQLGMKTGKGIYEWSDEKCQDFRKRSSAPFFKFFRWKLPEP